MRVTVVRNENRPVFAQAEYTVNIEETQPLGVSIATITAQDKDVVSANTMTGFIEPTCAYARWALIRHFLYGCDSTKIHSTKNHSATV